MLSRFIVFTLICLPQFLAAWGANGHRIVAQICYDNLNPAARVRVDKALGDNYLTQVANWPDFIKAEKGWDFAKPWHYMTVNTDRTIADVTDYNGSNPEINDVREGIELMTGILNGEAGAREKMTKLMKENRVEPLAGSLDATALAFLIHFIGDVHQPMHVGKNRDQGGNKISVMYFGERKNLHSIWDSGIIEHEKLSYTEFAAFAGIHTRARKAEWENAPLDEWIGESIQLREKLYNTLYDRTDRETGLPDFSWSYQHDFLPIVEERLAAAGYRAAALLNRVFG
ncbi:S1/P1 nuclease [Neolewinella aurantiaca]|uniref:S1/P1 nuclease n=1 Tax=Neolewinella aurantiaca TaxID=2602767 RepID=A0A5C7FS62_9BACT|nr:S1/P1 nuclease [Neolewinella aurantiaca]TXF89014.1 S1/P1 nuclease [Neolewinella aurantiaca]